MPQDALILVDAPPDVPTGCAALPAGGTHKVFLQFEGATLTRAASDATLNQFTIIEGSHATATVPRWKAAAVDRAAQIQSVVCAMRESLLPFDVEVVTTRPAAGDFEMVVIGGSYADLGYTFGSNTFIFSFASPDCANANTRDVSWVAERTQPAAATALTAAETANNATAGIGIGDGLGASKAPLNCMCSVTAGEIVTCGTEVPCTFSTSATFQLGGDVCSAGGAAEDQVAKLLARYGARP